MTREDVKKLFPDATDDQITAILNQHNSEVATEKGKAEKLKADAKKAEEYRQQLDELNAANMSDLEKANKATEDANKRVADLEKEMLTLKTKASLAEQGIVGEVADKLIESIQGGNIDASVLGQIISEREKAAIAKYEQDQMNSTPDASGKGGDNGDGKTSAEKIAETLLSNKPAEGGKTIIDQYTRR